MVNGSIVEKNILRKFQYSLGSGLNGVSQFDLTGVKTLADRRARGLEVKTSPGYGSKKGPGVITPPGSGSKKKISGF